MIAEILKKEFALTKVSLKPLEGYDNKNYLVESDKGRFVFKTYPQKNFSASTLEAENETLLFLNKQDVQGLPKPVPFLDDTYLKTKLIDSESHYCRMLTYIEGTPMGTVEPTESLAASLGGFMATIDHHLAEFDHVALRARQSEWDLQYLDLNKEYLNDIADARKRSISAYFFQQYEQVVRPLLPKLRKSVIHNDANEWNLLVSGEEITGLIDFGDLSHSMLINEVAIALTYIGYRSEDPLKLMVPFLEAYHKKLPLLEEEISILYYLIAARLCTSVCNSAHSAKTNPGNEYAQISDKKAWTMLFRWLQIGPIAAENIFREAVGFQKNISLSEGQLKSLRDKHLSKIVSISYDKPIHLKKAAFQYMYDAHGNGFLDAYNNIPHVGHCHPKVVEAGQRQMAQLNTNTRYLYDQLHQYAEKLLSKFPGSLNKVFFVNSGSAASDLAIRLAQAHTKRQNLLVMEHGYHGNTQIGIDVSDYKFNNPKGQGQKQHIFKTVLPDTYRGAHTQNDGTAGKAYAEEATRNLENLEWPLAAFIAEPIVGCGGQVPLAKGYLKPVYEAIRKQGGICISDEVQVGFGRLGNFFWGFEMHNVVPDIVILGKPMGNGHPIGAVVTTEAIAASFEEGVEFFSSFGGNPVSCAIGSAVLEVIEGEGLQQHAQMVGDYYQKCLKELQKEYACIGDVRGSGLFLGIDLVEEGTTQPDTQLAHHIKNSLRMHHILVSTDGPADNVIKSKPPLCFTKENVDEVVEALKQELTDFYH